MIMYPTMMTAMNAAGASASSPSDITDAASTDVPINAPPMIRVEVSSTERSLNPTPKAAKNNITDDVPNVLPLSSAVMGRKPVSPCATTASKI